jgi:flavin-dependent dehydrogenase
MIYDAILVGARCAGSPTAMLLARKGYRILLVDRASFPSDTVSTQMIWPQGVRSLQRWGLLDRVTASGCPPIRHVTINFGGRFAIDGTPPASDGVTLSYAPRRTILDKILVDAAVEAGAELREGFVVQELLFEGDQVVGIRGRARDGSTVEERARLVIGADGARSFVARSTQAPTYDEHPPRTFQCYARWSGIPLDGFYGWGGPRGMVGMLPTNDGLTLVNLLCPVAGFTAFREDVEKNYLEIATSIPAVAEHLQGAKREDLFISTADLPNYFRRPFGPGWALVGDAGYTKDPITAQGISDSFRDAELLAEAVDDAFSGRRPTVEAFAEHERRRNAAVLPMYEYTLELASMEHNPAGMALLMAISRSPHFSDRFAGAFVGTVPLKEFYSPENVARMLSASGGAPADRA